MATHNQVRVVGFLKSDPQIYNMGVEGAEKAIFIIRTMHRELDGFFGAKFQDLMIYYDGTELMPRIKKLSQYDLIDIKGVFNILTLSKTSLCPVCGTKNVKYNGTSTFVYPISLIKLNGMKTAFEHDEKLPERILETHFKEVSNQILIVGTIVNEPQMVLNGKNSCCRYQLGVDRKYYIKTQGELTADYPWIYSYSQQAERDMAHLKKGTVVLIDGFIQNRQVKSNITCDCCGNVYQYDDAATEFIPYAVEYMSDYITDEEIAHAEMIQAREQANLAKNAIFAT